MKRSLTPIQATVLFVLGVAVALSALFYVANTQTRGYHRLRESGQLHSPLFLVAWILFSLISITFKAASAPVQVPFYVTNVSQSKNVPKWPLQGVFRGTYQIDKDTVKIFIKSAKIRFQLRYPNGKTVVGKSIGGQPLRVRLLYFETGIGVHLQKKHYMFPAEGGFDQRSKHRKNRDVILANGEEVHFSNLSFTLDRREIKDISKAWLSFAIWGTNQLQKKNLSPQEIFNCPAHEGRFFANPQF